MPSAGNSIAENGGVTTERYAQAVDMLLAVGFPVCFGGYRFVAGETELDETMQALKVIFVAAVHVAPSTSNCNADVTKLVAEA